MTEVTEITIECSKCKNDFDIKNIKEITILKGKKEEII